MPLIFQRTITDGDRIQNPGVLYVYEDSDVHHDPVYNYKDNALAVRVRARKAASTAVEWEDLYYTENVLKFGEDWAQVERALKAGAIVVMPQDFAQSMVALAPKTYGYVCAAIANAVTLYNTKMVRLKEKVTGGD